MGKASGPARRQNENATAQLEADCDPSDTLEICFEFFVFAIGKPLAFSATTRPNRI